MKHILLSTIIVLLITSCNESKNYEVAFKITEKDLIPEGITYSEKTKCFYVSSILKTKIVQVDSKTGEFKDFIPSSLYKRRFVGMMVDIRKNHLWACGNYKIDSITLSSIFKFDVTTQKLIKEYLFPDTAQQLVNDIVIDSKGNAYFTNSNGQHVYNIDHIKDTIELFFESNEIEYPNGITISPDNQHIYVACYEKGIRVIDTKSKKVVNKINKEIDSEELDGIKYYNNSIIGIQNYLRFPEKNSIKIFYLDNAGIEITGVKCIDKNNPYFEMPTTHVIVNNEIFCLANSSLGNVDWEKYEIKNTEILDDIVILKYKL